MSSPASPSCRDAACPRCGRATPIDAVLGACPHCLLAAGFSTEPAAPADAAPPPTIAELAPEFPQLELIELLGRGGMGAVYQARQRSLGRLVALKLLRPGLDADPSFAERFTREARALAQLNHPGIVTLYEFGRTPGGLFFILMEFVDGVNLRQLIAAGRLSPREALAIIPPLCDALQYAHDRRVVHRDIKPENILIDRLGRVKIADFGLAKLAATSTPPTSSIPGSSTDAKKPSPSDSGHWPSVTDHSGLTEAGKVMGTPRYMAPEQRTQPDSVDHRADIYALGVVLYQMLTGELPDAGQIQPPSHRVQIDVRLDEIVLRALAKEPSRRYAAASEFKTQVEQITQSPRNSEEKPPAPSTSPASASAAAPTTIHPTSAPPTARRRWYRFKRLQIPLAVVLVLLLLRTFVLTPYRLESDSLDAVIPRGSWLFVYRLQQRFAPGDIVAYQQDAGTVYVGRVATAGQMNGELFVTRNNRAPLATPISAVIGRVVFNTRSPRVAPIEEPASTTGNTTPKRTLSSSDRQILLLRLAQAERLATEAQEKLDTGLSTQAELETAKDRVALFKAELAGDVAKILQIQLAAAERHLEYVKQRLQSGLSTRAELDHAETQVAILKLELQSAGRP